MTTTTDSINPPKRSNKKQALKTGRKKRKRQAVIIVHGMGEQKPMTTLRGFAQSILDYEEQEVLKDNTKKESRWVKPNVFATAYNSKRITARSRRYRPATDFMEYYWAHHMRDNKLSHIWGWFRGLLFKTKIPKRLVGYWIFSWVLVLLFIYSAISIVIPQVIPIHSESQFLGISLQKLTSFLLGGCSTIGQYFLIGYLGDAARYLRMAPENVKEHDKILKEGIELIESVANAKHPQTEYDRIIIVAHSLGSVVAYEIISHLWAKYYKDIHFKDSENNEIFKQLTHNVQDCALELQKEKLSDEERNQFISSFQIAQRALWSHMKNADHPWLISDFVTMGSPLNHGAFLMANSEDDFNMRIDQREFPTCPPERENDQYYFARKNEPIRLHHGAPFACIRWTNLFYPGDFIGGAISPSFGLGIKDQIAHFQNKKSFGNHLPSAHAFYWSNALSKKNVGQVKEKDTIAQLFHALDLNQRKWNKVKKQEENMEDDDD